MDLAQHFRAMARNNAWANGRLHHACARLSHDAFVAPRTGFLPSLQRTLNHILIVDRADLADLHGAKRSLSGEELLFQSGHDFTTAQRQAGGTSFAASGSSASSAGAAPPTW